MWRIISPASCKDSAKVLQDYMNDAHPISRLININWGNSRLSLSNPVEVWGNKLEAVARSADKARFFSLLKDDGTVPVITEFAGPCYQHPDPYGHNGSGIRYVDREEDFIPGLLTTKQIKGEEFRVYFCYDSPPKIYKKAPLSDGLDSPIRNSHNGYGYMTNPPELREVPNLKEVLLSLTKQVANKLELSHGAVDFILSRGHKVYMLESNSAPTLFDHSLVGMFGDTFIRRWV